MLAEDYWDLCIAAVDVLMCACFFVMSNHEYWLGIGMIMCDSNVESVAPRTFEFAGMWCDRWFKVL
jgi:hypothetical protein